MKQYPSYCCQQCGECIGWLGRFIESINFRLIKHECLNNLKRNKMKEILEDGSVKGQTFSGEKYKGKYPHPMQNETYYRYKLRVDNLKQEGFDLGDLSWRDYDIYCVGYGYQNIDKDDLIFED